MKKFRFLNLRVTTYSVSLMLVASAWLPLARPRNYMPFGFAGLAFPVLWIIVIILMAVLWKTKRPYWRIPLLALVLSVRGIIPYFAFGGIRGDVGASAKSFTVMTFNSSSMGLKKYKTDTPIVHKIDEVLREASPDILCMEEFYTNTRPDRDRHLQRIREAGNYPYHYFAPHFVNWKTWHYGTIVFSRFPIIDSARIPFKGGYGRDEDLLRLRLLVHGDTVGLLVAHFASYQLNSDQYNFRRAILPFSGRRLTKRLIAQQANILKDEMEKIPEPIIVTGDFNDVPLSYTYHTVRGNRLQDAWLERGFGLGRTFSSISPTLRIDYMLPDERFQVEDVKVYRSRLLQHFPLSARLSLRR
ncbi:endonuclease/exonuclease/phosphatase family protein [Chitinophaga rhizosphaerae]|uniref:endonuclease/exonuclease/phosphatase family protein n=1 Tax=Chitinophaga rhizosphaerae TaxID=1864947 RepID=UPI000F805543|nr:endonuclease/exonuclease/phosphatase family protein [Chitinophaga rhizosphaerae]